MSLFPTRGERGRKLAHFQEDSDALAKRGRADGEECNVLVEVRIDGLRQIHLVPRSSGLLTASEQRHVRLICPIEPYFQFGLTCEVKSTSWRSDGIMIHETTAMI